MVGAFFLGLVASCGAVRTPPATSFDGFDARFLLVASDVDMPGTAYANGRLRPLAGARDTLTVFGPGGAVLASLPAPNSVMSWPAIADVTPDGRRAVVVEVRGVPPDGVDRYDDIYTDMPAGGRVTVVDLTGPGGPAILSSTSAAVDPRSVSIHPVDGTVAMDDHAGPGSVLLFDISPEGALGPARRVPIPGALLETYGEVQAIRWHPQAPVMAVNLGNVALAFLRLDGDEAAVIGQPVRVGRWLTAGEFVHDGRHFLIPDVGWSEQSSGYVFNDDGSLISIAFDEAGDHRVVSSATVGLSPEGFAVSPDETLAVTVNMRRTYLPGGFVGMMPVGLVHGRDTSSLSLLRIGEDGTLTPIGEEVGLPAVLPEDAVFDRDGDTVAVTAFHGWGTERDTGWVAFYEVRETDDGVPALVPTDERWSVPRGPHDMVVVP